MDEARTLTATVSRVTRGAQTSWGSTPIPGHVPVGGSVTAEAYTSGTDPVVVGMRAWVTGRSKPGFQLVVQDSTAGRVVAPGSPRTRVYLSSKARTAVRVRTSWFRSLALGNVPLDPRSAATASSASNPFAVSSPWRRAIKPDARLNPAGSTMVARVTGSGKVYANLREFAIPVYTAPPGTPTYTVACTVTWWGPCPFAGIATPIPSGARPSTGSDSSMVVVDENAGKIYELWQVARTATGWQTSFGAVNDLSGSGWGGAGTGSGASRLAGVVRVDEIKSGLIRHAVAMQSNNVCKDRFVAPAVKTDGTSTRADCLPEGTRLRLDPSFDVAAAAGLTAGERTVARALKTYGGVIVDKGGAGLSLSFELDKGASVNSIGAVYTRAGFRWDYDGMDSIPWNRLQVLQ